MIVVTTPTGRIGRQVLGTVLRSGRPVRVISRGRRLRVLAGAGCPAMDAGVAGVVNPDPSLAHELVPPGRPRTGLECVYCRSVIRSAPN